MSVARVPISRDVPSHSTEAMLSTTLLARIEFPEAENGHVIANPASHSISGSIFYTSSIVATYFASTRDSLHM